MSRRMSRRSTKQPQGHTHTAAGAPAEQLQRHGYSVLNQPSSTPTVSPEPRQMPPPKRLRTGTRSPREARTTLPIETTTDPANASNGRGARPQSRTKSDVGVVERGVQNIEPPTEGGGLSKGRQRPDHPEEDSDRRGTAAAGGRRRQPGPAQQRVARGPPRRRCACHQGRMGRRRRADGGNGNGRGRPATTRRRQPGPAQQRGARGPSRRRRTCRRGRVGRRGRTDSGNGRGGPATTRRRQPDQEQRRQQQAARRRRRGKSRKERSTEAMVDPEVARLPTTKIDTRGEVAKPNEDERRTWTTPEISWA